jgi:hypothetical protein
MWVNRHQSGQPHVASWHNSDMPPLSLYVRCWGQSGKHMLPLSFSAFDPYATLAVTNGNALDADFYPYPSACLKHYDAVS